MSQKKPVRNTYRAQGLDIVVFVSDLAYSFFQKSATHCLRFHLSQ